MAARQRISIPAGLRSLYPTRWLNAAGREAGLVRRRRKVVPAHLFWTLVLSAEAVDPNIGRMTLRSGWAC